MQDGENFVVFFDIDNTLYSSSFGVSEAMSKRIHRFFVSMGLSDEEADIIHRQLNSDYGLSVRGAAEHYGIDPLEFDSKCDAALPLETLLLPSDKTRSLLTQINRDKVRIWALTNAYKTHAHRVLKILQIDDLFEGCISCNYDQPNFPCKPEPEFYHFARKEVGIQDPSRILFIDDSLVNVQAAKRLGWGSCVWFNENRDPALSTTQALQDVDAIVTDLSDLRSTWAWIFAKE